MGARLASRPLLAAVVSVALTAFGGTSLAMTMRSAPSPTPEPAKLQRFERAGEFIPAPPATPRPTVKPKPPKKKRIVAAERRPIARETPTPSPPSPPKPAPVPTPKPPPTPAFSAPKASSSGQNNTALLIGINKAPGSDVLQGMVEDTRTMRTMLLRAGYKDENIRILTDGKATRSAILAELDRLAHRTSGKGLAVVSISSHSGISGGDMTFATGGGGRISRAELAARLGKVRGRLWTTISTCYSAAYDTPGITGSNRIAMFTASKDELSYQNAAGSVSIVHMIQSGMIDRGIRSVEDAYEFAKSSLRAAGAASKVPILKDGIPGDVVPGELR